MEIKFFQKIIIRFCRQKFESCMVYRCEEDYKHSPDEKWAGRFMPVGRHNILGIPVWYSDTKFIPKEQFECLFPLLEMMETKPDLILNGSFEFFKESVRLSKEMNTEVFITEKGNIVLFSLIEAERNCLLISMDLY